LNLAWQSVLIAPLRASFARGAACRRVRDQTLYQIGMRFMIEQPVALVTGSSRGIGAGVALELARQGHAVAVNYCRSREAADGVVQQITALPGRAVALQGDVGVAADRQRLLEQTLDAFGRLDVLVNNAGITSPGRRDVLEASEENFDLVFATNLKGPFFLAQLAAREMIDKIGQGKITRGTIVNISSISAYAVSTNRPDYCMAKAAMQMMTWLLAARLAEEQIRVYEICPGVIASDMTAPVQEKYDRLIADGLSPIRRWGQPEDVGRAVAAVVSDAFPFTTGERISVDGGYHMRRL
jgi:NAD(P)-dependent dehydrogenase (short-subunit alcohol dehydrogenase family)